MENLRGRIIVETEKVLVVWLKDVSERFANVCKYLNRGKMTRINREES